MRKRIPLFLFAILFTCPPARAADPLITNLDIRGLQSAATTTLTFDGQHFGTTPRLLLPFPAKQTLKPGTTDKRALFEVTLPPDTTPGYHHLRLVTDFGISPPILIGVDALPQKKISADVETIPAAIHGVASGSNTALAKFLGKAKQKILIEVEAHRLGSKLRPVIHLYGPSKLQVAWSWPSFTLAGDTRLEAVLPEDGTYTVALHDLEYAAADPSFFRLKIGDWSFVDQVFPPVVAKGKPQAVEFLGPAAPLRTDLAPQSAAGAFPLPWPKPGTWSGPRPFVEISNRPEFLEQPPGKIQDLPEGPLGVSGRLLTPNEEDRYRLAVTPGKKLRLEVFAERLGSPLDVALVIRNEKGDQITRVEDGPASLDPVLEYVVPDKTTSIIVGVVDAQGKGGPRGIYRLTVDPAYTPKPGEKSDGYKVSTPLPSLSLPAAGSVVMPVTVDRHGYVGKIDLLPSHSPAGIIFTGTEIPEGADGTLITIARGDASFDPTVLTWRTRRADGAENFVFVKGHPLETLQPWLATEIALAPSLAKTADFLAEWRDASPDGLVLGDKLALPIKITRPDTKTPVKLTLLTSQAPILVNNQPDPNKTLRQEKAVDLPAKETKGDLTLLVPVELPAPAYDVTVKAELLGPDNKVAATSFTPVRRLQVQNPLLIRLAGPPRIEVVLDKKTGATLKIPGKIERRPGTKSDVTLALTGLPAGAKADPVTLKADAVDFAFTVTLPPNVPPGEIKSLKISASFVPDPKQANLLVRSREVELTLVIQAPKK